MGLVALRAGASAARCPRARGSPSSTAGRLLVGAEAAPERTAPAARSCTTRIWDPLDTAPAGPPVSRRSVTPRRPRPRAARALRPRTRRPGDHRGHPGRARLLEHRRARPAPERGPGRRPPRAWASWTRRWPPPPSGTQASRSSTSTSRATAPCSPRSTQGDEVTRPASRSAERLGWTAFEDAWARTIAGRSCARRASTRGTPAPRTRPCTTRSRAGSASCACDSRFRPRSARAAASTGSS